MQVSVETTGVLERRMTVRVPVERVDREIENRLRTLAQQAKVAGFRPGKVPYKVVQRKFGEAVRREVLGDLMQSSLRDALVQEKLRLAGGPRIEPNIEAGAGLEYTATFEVYPEFSPAGLDTLKITRPAAEIGDQDVDAMLEKLRRQRIAWETVQRPSQAGDRAIIDYKGDIAGAEFPGNAGDKVPVVLGSGAYLKSFEDQLTGVSAGAEHSFEVAFPEDYHAKEVAGKTVHFQAKVHSVAEPRPPEVDEAFARAFGVTEGGVEALRKEIRDNMRRELDATLRAQLKGQVMDALLKANTIDLPKSLVQREIERLREDARAHMAADSSRSSDLPDTLFEEQARRRVALGLIITEIVRANGIQADPVRVRAQVESIASTYEQPEEVVKWYYSNPSFLESVQGLVLEEQVVDWLLERADISETHATFDALMHPSQATLPEETH